MKLQELITIIMVENGGWRAIVVGRGITDMKDVRINRNALAPGLIATPMNRGGA